MTVENGQMSEIYPGVVVDPRIVHGVPIIKGTRIPARLVVGHLAAGDNIEAVMDAYGLSEQQVRTALGYAAERLGAENVYVLAGEE